VNGIVEPNASQYWPIDASNAVANAEHSAA